MAFPVGSPALVPAPASGGAGVAISGDGQIIAAARNGLYIHKLAGGVYNKVCELTGNPADMTKLSMSSDGTYILGTALSYPNWAVFKRTPGTDTWVQLSTPSPYNNFQALGNGTSPDGTYFGVAYNILQFLSMFKKSGADAFTEIYIPLSTTGSHWDVNFSADGDYVVVATSNAPYFAVYYRSGDTFTQLANPTVSPGGEARSARFSPDGKRVVVSNSTAPYLHIYDIAGTGASATLTKRTDLIDVPPAGNVYSSIVGNDYIWALEAASPFQALYVWDGTQYIRQAPRPALPDNSQSSARNADGKVVAVSTYNTSPYVTVFADPVPPTANGAIVLPKLKVSGFIGDFAETKAPKINVLPALAYMRGTSGFVKSQDAAINVGGDFVLPKFMADGEAKYSQSVHADLVLPKRIASGLVTLESRSANVQITLPKLGFSGLAIENPQLTFDLYLPKFTADGLVFQPVRINGAGVLPKLDLDATVFQTVQIDAGGGLSLPALTADGLVFQPVRMLGNIELPALTADGLVFQPVRIDTDLLLPAFTADGEIDPIYPVYDPVGEFVLPAFTADGEITMPLGGRADAVLPAFTADGLLYVEVWATVTATLPAFVADGLVGVEGFIYADLSLPRLGFSGELGYPILVDANLQLPALKFQGGGGNRFNVELDPILPMFRMRGIVRNGDPLPSTGSGAAVGLDGDGGFQLGGNIKFGNGRRTFP